MAMTMTDQTTPAVNPFRFTMLIPMVLVNVAAPIAILKMLEWFGVSPIWAVAGGCVPPALNNLYAWITARRLDPVGLVMMASIVSGAVASMVSGNLFYKLLTDALLNVGWGSVFLVSLLFSRPLIFFLIRSVVAGDDASRAQAWNGLWRYPVFRSEMRAITATWSAVYFVEVLIEAALSRLLAPDTVSIIASLMGVGATLALLVFTRLRMRTTRARLERVEHVTWPL